MSKLLSTFAAPFGKKAKEDRGRKGKKVEIKFREEIL